MGCSSSAPQEDFSLPGHSRVVTATSRRRIRPTYDEKDDSLSYSETSSRAYSGSTTRVTNEFDSSDGRITRANLALHTTKESLWISIDGKVFDVTSFQPNHPGGVDNILYNGGRDATKIFYASHGPHVTTRQLRYIGRLVN